MSKKIGIYKITNLANNKVYIGQSTDVNKRIKEGHIYKLKKNKHNNKHLQMSWNKYCEDNFKFEIIEECDTPSLNEREQYWMDYYKSYDKNYGYNIIPNANSNLGWSHSEESKKKISIATTKENNPFFGKRHTEENKKIMSKKRKVKIVQIDLNGDLVKVWDSIKDASENFNITPTPIRYVCSGKTKTSCDFIWMYLDDYDKNGIDIKKYFNNDMRNISPVLQYTKDMKFIREYNSINEAYEITKINNISACCRGIQKSSGGFIWKYKEGELNE